MGWGLGSIGGTLEGRGVEVDIFLMLYEWIKKLKKQKSEDWVYKEGHLFFSHECKMGTLQIQ